MAIQVVSAKGSFRTFSEGANQGNLLLNISIDSINGAWPGFPTGGGGTAGAQAWLSVFGATLAEDTGLRQTYQGSGLFLMLGPMGEALFRDDAATIFYTTVESSLPDSATRPEHLVRASVSGNSPLGAYGALTLGDAVVDGMGASSGKIALAHVDPPAPGALKKALRS